MFTPEQRKEFDIFLSTMLKTLPPPTYKRILQNKEAHKKFVQACAMSFVDILHKAQQAKDNSLVSFMENLLYQIDSCKPSGGL